MEVFVQSIPDFCVLQSTIFPVLCNLVHNFRNFKVRINAALALGVPEHRALYGQHFGAVWTALLAGLDNSEHMADFNEYKHRDALLDQVKERVYVYYWWSVQFIFFYLNAFILFLLPDMLFSLSYCLIGHH